MNRLDLVWFTRRAALFFNQSFCLLITISGGYIVKDLSRRIIISLTLATIIVGGMSVSLANMPENPDQNDDIIVQVQGE